MSEDGDAAKKKSHDRRKLRRLKRREGKSGRENSAERIGFSRKVEGWSPHPSVKQIA